MNRAGTVADLVRAGYDRAAERYLRQRDPFQNNIYLSRLVELLSLQSLVLDLGCGAGVPVDRYLIARGHRVIGIDISEKQIELACENVRGAEYRVRDMLTVQEGEFRVEAVVSFYAIFHTPREAHPELLAKVNSFLPSGGLVLVTMGASEWEGHEEDFCGVEMFWSHYDAAQNRQLLETSGTEILLDEIDERGGEKHQVLLARKR